MHFTDFASTFQWVIAHGYWLMLIAMIVEGPIVTSAAAFAATFNLFSLPVIFILSILGDLIADVIYYAVGYFGRISLVEKFGPKFGLSKPRIQKMENLLNAHSVKTMIVLKLNPVTPMPGLMLIGAMRMQLKRFTVISLLVTIPKTILFIILGYYFGKVYDSLAQYTSYTAYLVAGLVIVAIIIFLLYRKLSKKISDTIEPL